VYLYPFGKKNVSWIYLKHLCRDNYYSNGRNATKKKVLLLITHLRYYFIGPSGPLVAPAKPYFMVSQVNKFFNYHSNEHNAVFLWLKTLVYSRFLSTYYDGLGRHVILVAKYYMTQWFGSSVTKILDSNGYVVPVGSHKVHESEGCRILTI